MKKIFCLIPVFIFVSFSVVYSSPPGDEVLRQVLYPHRGLGPESLFMEPVYGDDDTVSAYCLGNLIKLDYFPAGSQSPSRRTVSMWNPDNAFWSPVVVTDILYDEQGKITREEFQEASRSAGRYNLKPDYIKTFTRTTVCNTRTVTTDYSRSVTKSEWPYREPIQKQEVFHSFTTTIHLNSAGLPDTIISNTADNYFTREVYRYDPDYRLIGMTTFYREPGKVEDYEEFSKTEIDYSCSGIYITCRGTERLKDYIRNYHGFYIDYMIPYIELSMGLVTCSFVFDESDRLISKSVELNGENILDIKHTYSGEGKCSTEAVIDPAYFGEFVGETLPRNFISNIQDYERFGYTVSYDDTGRRNIGYLFPIQRGYDYRTLMTIVDREDEKGRTVFYDRVLMDEYDERIMERQLNAIHYRPSDHGGETREVMCYRTDEPGSYIYDHPERRTLEHTDMHGNLVLVEMFEYDEYERVWEPDEIIKYGYDSNGYKASEEKSSYDIYDEWYPFSRITWQNDTLGRILKEEHYTATENGWRPESREEYAYDGNGNRTLYQESWYDPNRNRWYAETKIEDQYDINGNLVSKTEYEGDPDKYDWIPLKQTQFAYPEEYSMEITTFNWLSGAWEADYRVWEFVKEAPDVQTSYKTWAWNKTLKEWQPVKFTHKYTTENKEQVFEVYQWNEERGKLSGVKYEARTELPWLLATEYRKWNDESDIWTPFLKHTISGAPGDHQMNLRIENHLIELYDHSTGEWFPDMRVSRSTLVDPENSNSSSLTVISGWDKISQDWVDKTKIESLNRFFSRTPSRAEVFRYEQRSGDFIPATLFIREDDTDMYYIWNEGRAEYEYFYKYDHSSWYSEEFIWDSSVDNWIEAMEYGDENPDKMYDLMMQARAIKEMSDLSIDNIVNRYLSNEGIAVEIGRP